MYNIKVTRTTHGDILSTVAGNGEYFSRTYVGYSIEEAKELFTEHIIDSITSKIYNKQAVQDMLEDIDFSKILQS